MTNDWAEEQLRAELAPDLELVRPLGHGAVARVFLAREPALKRLVAVKVLRRELADNEVARRRFEREAQAAASIRHPNVTAVHRIGRLSDGIPYIVMEYIEGRTLADVLQVSGSQPINEVKRVLAALAHALAAAHGKGIVHRDVRPANVICENDSGRVVLMDFGIAALLETGAQEVNRLTTEHQRLGDPLHMSPEQVRGEPATQQSDVFSLGILGCELITGRVPNRHTEITPSSSDAALNRVIRLCLADKPNQRPRAQEVVEALLREPGSRDPASQPGSASLLRDFTHELAKRRVYRVAVAYIAAAFIALQGVQLLLPGLPVRDEDAWYRIAVTVVLFGFP